MLYPVMDRMSTEVHYWARLGIVPTWSKRLVECTYEVDSESKGRVAGMVPEGT